MILGLVTVEKGPCDSQNRRRDSRKKRRNSDDDSSTTAPITKIPIRFHVAQVVAHPIL